MHFLSNQTAPHHRDINIHLFKNSLNYLPPKEESFIFAGVKMNSNQKICDYQN